MKSKICGISDSKTLIHLTNHSYPPQYIGFIVNYPKSKRFVPYEKLKQILNVDKKKSKYVAVLVKPNEDILEKIKDLPFDYYQLYDCTPTEVRSIKEKYNKKIIVAITVKNQKDVLKYQEYKDIGDIFLWDSKGYEKSESFDHSYLDKLPNKLEKMIAGNIQIEDVSNFKDKSFIIDVSGSCENEEGKKDLYKIDKFLNTVHNISS
jgi:phosphoribosylanthranilate isomerase